MTSPATDVFEEEVAATLATLPPAIAGRVENVSVEIEDEDSAHPTRLGYYQGIPHTRRGSHYVLALPDRITIYRRPIERLYGHDEKLLRRRIRHVVLHELAHHFGISDERLREIGRY